MEHGSNALILWKAAMEMIRAPLAEDARSLEAAALEILRSSAWQRADVRRRASILVIDTDSKNDRLMRVLVGAPTHGFPKRLPLFTEHDYEQDRIGLCWRAIEDCGRAPNGIEQWVKEYSDLGAEWSSLKQVPDDPPFKSIMIAPIWRMKKTGEREPLGVVCLDSTESSFYRVTDKQLVVMTAAAVAIGWSKWRP